MAITTRKPFVVLVSGFGWHVEDLALAAKRLDLDLRPVLFPEMVGCIGLNGAVRAGGFDLVTEVSAVLVRMMPPGSLEQVVFRMDALQRLEAAGVPVLNPPRAVEVAVDKYLSLARLAAVGLPVPRTWAGETPEASLAAFEELGSDVIVKPLFGSEGRGLVRISDKETLWRVCHAVARVGGVLYLQEFIKSDSTDLRLFVLGGRVLGAIRRTAADGQWRANVAQGGKAQAVTVNRDVELLAIQAAAAVGATMAGVDLIETTTGHRLILEINAVPGWRALAKATGVDVSVAILDHLRGLAR